MADQTKSDKGRSTFVQDQRDLNPAEKEFLKDRERRFLEKLDTYTFFDDVFGTAFLLDRETAQQFLRDCFDDDSIIVTGDPETHVYYGLPGERAVISDVVIPTNKAIVTLEIQRDPRGVDPDRLRYTARMSDQDVLYRGEDPSRLPDRLVIMVAEKNPFETDDSDMVFRMYDPVHQVELTDYGVKIAYVNGEWKGDNRIGKLLHDLREPDPDKMYNPVYAKTSSKLKKRTAGGSMSENLEHVFNEYDMALVNYYRAREEQIRKETEAKIRHDMRMKAEQDDRNSFLFMSDQGLTPEQIAEGVKKPLDYVLKLLKISSSND